MEKRSPRSRQENRPGPPAQRYWLKAAKRSKNIVDLVVRQRQPKVALILPPDAQCLLHGRAAGFKIIYLRSPCALVSTQSVCLQISRMCSIENRQNESASSKMAHERRIWRIRLHLFCKEQRSARRAGKKVHVFCAALIPRSTSSTQARGFPSFGRFSRSTCPSEITVTGSCASSTFTPASFAQAGLYFV